MDSGLDIWISQEKYSRQEHHAKKSCEKFVRGSEKANQGGNGERGSLGQHLEVRLENVPGSHV
jgi:hypothetical protein